MEGAGTPGRRMERLCRIHAVEIVFDEHGRPSPQERNLWLIGDHALSLRPAEAEWLVGNMALDEIGREVVMSHVSPSGRKRILKLDPPPVMPKRHGRVDV